MSGWVKLANTAPERPKVADVSDAAFRLWITATCYCSRGETDGRVPKGVLRRLTASASKRVVDELLAARLLETNGTAYVVHDYLDYNPSREEIAALRDRSRRSSAKHRHGKRRDTDGDTSRKGAGDGSRDRPGDTSVTSHPRGRDRSVPERVSRDSEAPECRLLRWHADAWGSPHPKRWGDKQREAARWLLANVDHGLIVSVLRWAKGHRYWSGRASKIANVRSEWTAIKAQYDAERRGTQDADERSKRRAAALDRLTGGAA